MVLPEGNFRTAKYQHTHGRSFIVQLQFFVTFLSLKCQKGLKMAIFGLKMELSKNIFIWMTTKSCTREYCIIHFTIITFLWLKCQKDLKWLFLPENGYFGFHNGLGALQKYIFIWTTAKSCTREYGIIHFSIFFVTFLSLNCQKGLEMAWKLPFWISKWPWSSPKVFLSDRQGKVVIGSMVSSILLYFLLPLCDLNAKKA